MIGRLALVVLLQCGCRQVFGLDEPSLGGPADSGAGSDADASDASLQLDAASPLCFTSIELAMAGCVDSIGAPVVFANISINTDDVAVCTKVITPTTAPAICVIAGDTIDLAGNVAVSGSRSLVLLARGEITVEGTLDVASHRAGKVGPASGFGCTAGTDGSSQGGGAGGSFGGTGGDGGKGAANQSVAGHSATSHVPTFFAGGCRGTLGSNGDPTQLAQGGGAVGLFSSTEITVATSGRINASGAGGAHAATPSRGGYGGGAGGLVVLRAPMLVFSSGSQVFANGGGGGGGASNTIEGLDGGESSGSSIAGASGAGGNTAGDGGSGFPAAQQQLQGAAGGGGAGGGGGGGGGAGAIFGYGTISGVPGYSPAPHLYSN